MKIRKLDRRYTGYPTFKYFVDLTRMPRALRIPAMQVSLRMQGDRLNFYEIRKWCWETWGASKEVEFYLEELDNEESSCQNPHWAWSNQTGRFARCRIFLASEAEATMFTLKWL